MTTNQDDTIPRNQIETTLQFLEEGHGLALRAGQEGQAQAYYEAIDVLEGALNDELRAPDDIPLVNEENIERSRRARKAGYKEATLFDERTPDRSRERTSMVQKLRSFFSTGER